MISQFDKIGLTEFAKNLKQKKVEIISTGGTAKHLNKNNIELIFGIGGGKTQSSSHLTENLFSLMNDEDAIKGKIEVKKITSSLKINLTIVDASRKFLLALRGVKDPEKKRKIIGKCFIDVFDSEAKKIKNVKYLGQGTIYPDVIESSSKNSKSDVIKSHHNVGGLPDDMKMELVEPLRDLFKDEVRTMGSKLGLPMEMLNRHPFPGPGLGVRILGEISQEKVLILQNADAIFIEELIKASLYDQVSQAFCAFLPIKSVGVVGDERRYADVIAIRAVETVDFMTATWARLPYDFLDNVSNRIMNEISRVSRVVYDISGKPPATIEWE